MGFTDKIEARNVNPVLKARIVVITVIRLHFFAQGCETTYMLHFQSVM